MANPAAWTEFGESARSRRLDHGRGAKNSGRAGTDGLNQYHECEFPQKRFLADETSKQLCLFEKSLPHIVRGFWHSRPARIRSWPGEGLSADLALFELLGLGRRSGMLVRLQIIFGLCQR